MSFGMIFSIIIIIATLVLAGYFIKQFIYTSRCVDVQLFSQELQAKVDEVWRSSQAREPYTGNMPKNIESVCIGNLLSNEARKSAEYDLLKRYSRLGNNFFIYPPQKACDGSAATKKINHVNMSEFFCVKLKEGKASLNLIKDSSFESFVRIEP